MADTVKLTPFDPVEYLTTRSDCAALLLEMRYDMRDRAKELVAEAKRRWKL